jgi:hypothetical protein
VVVAPPGVTDGHHYWCRSPRCRTPWPGWKRPPRPCLPPSSRVCGRASPIARPQAGWRMPIPGRHQALRDRRGGHLGPEDRGADGADVRRVAAHGLAHSRRSCGQRVGIRAARQRQPTPESPQRIVTACTTHDAYGAEMQELRRLMQALDEEQPPACRRHSCALAWLPLSATRSCQVICCSAHSTGRRRSGFTRI